MSRPVPLFLAPVSERAFQQQVVDVARLLGYRVYHPWISVHSSAGFPDLVLVRPPRLVLAEVKTDRGRVTAAQQAWLDLLRACPGCETYVWRPSDDLAQIAEILR